MVLNAYFWRLRVPTPITRTKRPYSDFFAMRPVLRTAELTLTQRRLAHRELRFTYTVWHLVRLVRR